jgi:hypothetical protein
MQEHYYIAPNPAIDYGPAHPPPLPNVQRHEYALAGINNKDTLDAFLGTWDKSNLAAQIDAQENPKMKQAIAMITTLWHVFVSCAVKGMHIPDYWAPDIVSQWGPPFIWCWVCTPTHLSSFVISPTPAGHHHLWLYQRKTICHHFHNQGMGGHLLQVCHQILLPWWQAGR